MAEVADGSPADWGGRAGGGLRAREAFSEVKPAGRNTPAPLADPQIYRVYRMERSSCWMRGRGVAPNGRPRWQAVRHASLVVPAPNRARSRLRKINSTHSQTQKAHPRGRGPASTTQSAALSAAARPPPALPARDASSLIGRIRQTEPRRSHLVAPSSAIFLPCVSCRTPATQAKSFAGARRRRPAPVEHAWRPVVDRSSADCCGHSSAVCRGRSGTATNALITPLTQHRESFLRRPQAFTARHPAASHMAG